MPRYLHAVLPVLCIFLAVATVAAWVYSLCAFFFQPVYCHYFGCLFRSTRGVLLIRFFPAGAWSTDPTMPLRQLFFFAGFGVWNAAPPTGRIVEIAVPYWFLLLLFIFPPIRFFRRHRFFLTPRRERIAQKLCPTCGYDIRIQAAGQAGQKCPECGTPIANPRP